MTRLTVSRKLRAVAVAAVVGVALLTAFHVDDGKAFLVKPFTLAFIPDTQVYSEEAENTHLFRRQINWLLNNAESKNIVFVGHLGDVVDNGTDPLQWQRAMRCLNPLLTQDTLPFSIVRGNHDDPALFLKNLPVSLMSSKPWFAGASPSGLAQAQRFQVQGRWFLHIGFQKDPTAQELAWANALLGRSDFQRYPTIVTTHDYVVPGGRSVTGNFMWEKFVKRNKMIFLVVNGHTHTEYAFVSHNKANRPVFQVLADYQDRDFAGNGLMRLITIDPVLGTIKNRTFSPYYQEELDDGTIQVTRSHFEKDADSEFEFATNLTERFKFASTYDFGPQPSLPPPPALEPMPETLQYSHIFQNRHPLAGTETAYNGTVDTQINENNATLDYAGEMTLSTDLDDNGSRVHAMFRFDNIIGDGVGQIVPGSKIVSAKLVFNVTSSTKGTISMHRMLAPWTEKSVWMDFTPVDASGEPTWVPFTFYDPSTKQDVTLPNTMLGGGIQADDLEAMSEVDVSFGCPKPIPTPFIVQDVTKSVQAWADGQENLGWALLNNSTDGWDFQTGNGFQPPALLIVVEGAPLAQ
ncbi:MAG: metallophosphoesterase [Syntrophobacteraceae bacterium]